LIANILSPGRVEFAVEAAIALTAVQLLWINLTTDGLPAIALSVDPGDPDLMEQKPRGAKESIFTRDIKIYLTVVPILMTILLLFGYFYHRPWESETNLFDARTQLFTALILMELANALSARSLKYTVFKVGIFKNKILWYAILSSFALQLFVLYIPGVQTTFGLTTPGITHWVIALLSTAIIFSALEIGKYVATIRRNRLKQF
jgi:P-type Ca2+ transporter type 2C